MQMAVKSSITGKTTLTTGSAVKINHSRLKFKYRYTHMHIYWQVVGYAMICTKDISKPYLIFKLTIHIFLFYSHVLDIIRKRFPVLRYLSVRGIECYPKERRWKKKIPGWIFWMLGIIHFHVRLRIMSFIWILLIFIWLNIDKQHMK